MSCLSIASASHMQCTRRMKTATIPPVRIEFIRRGMAAINRTVAAGDGVPAEVVIAKLEKKLEAARKAKPYRLPVSYWH